MLLSSCTIPASLGMNRLAGNHHAAGAHESTATVESTRELLDLARGGNQAALDRLFERYMAPLKRWAHGRLPRWARDLRDTDDLVQESVLQTLKQIDRFEPIRDGAFHAYLRRVLQNRLLDEIRRVNRAPHQSLDSDRPDPAPSPVEEVIGRQTLERYEAGLLRLKPEERDAVVARIELGQAYAEIAASLGKTSADAARMFVSRALIRLAQEMQRGL
jgi:RNA polymerase sigma factor (sigma-70 family)